MDTNINWPSACASRGICRICAARNEFVCSGTSARHQAKTESERNDDNNKRAFLMFVSKTLLLNCMSEKEIRNLSAQLMYI